MQFSLDHNQRIREYEAPQRVSCSIPSCPHCAVVTQFPLESQSPQPVLCLLIQCPKRPDGSFKFQFNAIFAVSPGENIFPFVTKTSRPADAKAAEMGSKTLVIGSLGLIVRTDFLSFFFLFIYLFCFFMHLQYMEVPRLGVQSELQLPVYATATATATRDPSHVCDLHHSSWQRWIFNPRSEARNQTRNLMDASQVHLLLSHKGNSLTSTFIPLILELLNPGYGRNIILI